MSDIIRPIEPFFLTQGFGGNAEAYAKFGLKGHNGWDIRTKYPDTPEGRRNIVASFSSKFFRKGDEGSGGYGKYFEVIVKLKNTWKLTYGHCHSILDFANRHEGEEMAISDNTGNSTGPHVHFTVKRVVQNSDGTYTVQSYSNGYFGAVNPQEFFDELREVKNAGNPIPSTGMEMLPKDNVLRDILIGLCGETSDDEISAYLSSQKNIQEVVVDVASGNGRFYDKWVRPHVEIDVKPIITPEEIGETEEPDTDTTPQTNDPQNPSSDVPSTENINLQPITQLVSWIKENWSKYFGKK